jgi:hypothetical protein
MGTADDQRLDAAHNLYLAEATAAAADLREENGQDPRPWRQRAGELRRAVFQAFWDGGRGCYWSFRSAGQPWHRAEAIQALAACHGLPGAPPEVPGDSGLIPITLSSVPYAAMAAWGAPLDRQTRLLDWCRRVYGDMLRQGATSLWETALGAADFGGAGSLCHGWSALPVWIARAYVLGVRPLAAGFSRVEISPHCADLPEASGTVPTPHGPIAVAWQRHAGQCRVKVTAPAACQLEFRPPETPGLTYRLQRDP